MGLDLRSPSPAGMGLEVWSLYWRSFIMAVDGRCRIPAEFNHPLAAFGIGRRPPMAFSLPEASSLFWLRRQETSFSLNNPHDDVLQKH